MPGATTLATLALRLGVPEHLVVEKALASAGYGDLGVAARRGPPLQVQKDALEPDSNVDPEGPEQGA